MTRADRIARFLEAMSDDMFDNFLAAAEQAVREASVYASLPPPETAAIDAAMARLDRDQGVTYADLKGRLSSKLTAAGA